MRACGHVYTQAYIHVRRHACGHAHRYVTRHACELGPRRNHGHKLGDLARPDLVRASGADKKQCGVNPADRSGACAGGAKPRKTTSMNLVISYDAPSGTQTQEKQTNMASSSRVRGQSWQALTQNSLLHAPRRRATTTFSPRAPSRLIRDCRSYSFKNKLRVSLFILVFYN